MLLKKFIVLMTLVSMVGEPFAFAAIESSVESEDAIMAKLFEPGPIGKGKGFSKYRNLSKLFTCEEMMEFMATPGDFELAVIKSPRSDEERIEVLTELQIIQGSFFRQGLYKVIDIGPKDLEGKGIFVGITKLNAYIARFSAMSEEEQTAEAEKIFASIKAFAATAQTEAFGDKTYYSIAITDSLAAIEKDPEIRQETIEAIRTQIPEYLGTPYNLKGRDNPARRRLTRAIPFAIGLPLAALWGFYGQHYFSVGIDLVAMLAVWGIQGAFTNGSRTEEAEKQKQWLEKKTHLPSPSTEPYSTKSVNEVLDLGRKHIYGMSILKQTAKEVVIAADVTKSFKAIADVLANEDTPKNRTLVAATLAEQIAKVKADAAEIKKAEKGIEKTLEELTSAIDTVAQRERLKSGPGQATRPVTEVLNYALEEYKQQEGENFTSEQQHRMILVARLAYLNSIAEMYRSDIKKWRAFYLSLGKTLMVLSQLEERRPQKLSSQWAAWSETVRNAYLASTAVDN